MWNKLLKISGKENSSINYVGFSTTVNVRSRQDLNLRGKFPTDFESVALTTRPRLHAEEIHLGMVFMHNMSTI